MEVEIALQKVIENPNDAALLKKFKEKLAKLPKDPKLEIETLISKLNDFKGNPKVTNEILRAFKDHLETINKQKGIDQYTKAKNDDVIWWITKTIR